MKKQIFALLIVFLFSIGVQAEDGYIGNVKTLKGEATVTRGENVIDAELGLRLEKGDLVKTSSASAVGIIFVDSTLVTIGPSSELFLNNYVFEPKDKEYAFDVLMKKGSAIYDSGKLGKLEPGAVKFRTPKATIGIRGTRFYVEVE
ncbi:FecR family protein [Limisalsivibrio acetivorans]|uniref:FecR family protein n=1 Tax=Limisalsivibrio acetivorans TaxID=1304888 RepID=UPI0003B774D2|nr:FecR domain-containing protein [Limisalsivibrio acetivorans]